jgi:hypothetical protein
MMKTTVPPLLLLAILTGLPDLNGRARRSIANDLIGLLAPILPTGPAMQRRSSRYGMGRDLARIKTVIKL